MKFSLRIDGQFRGPPNSGNGGYVCGLMAAQIPGPSLAILRSPPPLDVPVELLVDAGEVRLLSGDGVLIGEAKPAYAGSLPEVPEPPSPAESLAAGLRFPGLSRPFHPVCFTCGDRLDDGYGLRVFTGQVEGRPEGVVAGPFELHSNFAGEDGLAPLEIVWAILDCPGSVSWVVKEGGWGLLGTMTCQVLRRPASGEKTTVLAWPIEQSGRKRISGTALLSEAGEVMARSLQIWIGRA